MTIDQSSDEVLPPKRDGHISTALRALKHRNYRLWFFGQGFSLIGTWMQTVAQQVLVYRLTGSASALGIVNFMAIIPLVPLALWGGSISDRFPKRVVILCTQSLMLIQAVILGVITLTGVVEVWHIYLMSFMLGALKAVDSPARHSFAIEMVEGKDDLTSAIGLNSAIFNGARTLGPALAGLAVATMGEAVAFFLNSLSFLAVIISLLSMRNLPKAAPHQADTHMAAHIGEGIRFVLNHQVLLVLMSLVAVNSFLSMPYITLMPVFANVVLKSSAQPVVSFLCGGSNPVLNCQTPEALPLGLLLTSVGIGSVTGALIVASLSERSRRGWLLTLGNLGLPLALLLFANTRSMLLALGLMLLTGLGHVLQNAMANTLLQINAPDRLRGRVMGQYSLVAQGTTNLGGLQAGFVADSYGAPFAISVGAAMALIYGLIIALRYKHVRELV
ncbi:MAG: MFS transporter [Anaerolineaceae bacterium]